MNQNDTTSLQTVVLRVIFVLNSLIMIIALIFSDAFIGYVNQNAFLKSAVAISYCFGSFYLWGSMFYHWGTHQFKENKHKTIWFWSMILGLHLGAYVYYLFVYELRKTLK